ncbi:MAG TPA: hypothetical protein VEX38_04210 [Fimbriimonadaceae bacterium]|nr:hypothetical protein [Fimbriimonadaceae bacterium]
MVETVGYELNKRPFLKYSLIALGFGLDAVGGPAVFAMRQIVGHASGALGEAAAGAIAGRFTDVGYGRADAARGAVGAVLLAALVGSTAGAIRLLGGSLFSKLGEMPFDRTQAETAKQPSYAYNHNYPYHDRVLARGLEDPRSHNFPYSFDDDILATPPIHKPNGYTIYQAPGEFGGREGYFEIGVTKDGIIDHRFFRPK